MKHVFILLSVVMLVAAPANASAVTKKVVAVGDIACEAKAVTTEAACRHREVSGLAERLRPDSIWLLGDIQYPRGSIEDFRSGFGAAWSKHRRVWRPTPGNHEYMTKGASGYFDFFGASTGPAKRGWYSFELGNWHVVSLNSNCDVIACGFRSLQLRWLRNDLKRNDKKCVAAFWHHPRFSSGGHGANAMTSGLFRELRKARVEFVLTGHDHDYERFAPMTESGVVRRDGVRQFVVGTGGKSKRSVGEPVDGSRFLKGSTFGALEMKLRAGRYNWRYIEEGGSSFDVGSAKCR